MACKTFAVRSANPYPLTVDIFCSVLGKLSVFAYSFWPRFNPKKKKKNSNYFLQPTIHDFVSKSSFSSKLSQRKFNNT